MIRDDLAKPIVNTATKAFIKRYDPNKPTFQLIFHNHWDDFLLVCKGKSITVPEYKQKEVEEMMACGTLDMGFEIYECPNCHRHHIICYTCKSRFCPSCGAKATRARAYRISKSTLDVNHRHMVFTIDDRLRDYFWIHQEWLRFLFDAANEAIFYTFNKTTITPKKISKKNRRKRKKKTTITPGFIITLHTYGRDLKWNPHVHVLCTEGGMNQDHIYKALPYINYASLRKSFMKQLLDKMKDALSDEPAQLKQFKNLITTLYKEDTNGFYVNAPPRDMKSSGKDQVVKYMIRYAGKPAMAQSRIISYNPVSSTIKYYYEDHKTNERIEVEETVFRFISKLLRHIPLPQFKMVRYYGIYATCDHSHKKTVKRILFKTSCNKNHNRPKHYRSALIDTFGIDPLLCICGSYMEFVDSYVPSRFRSGVEPP